MHETPLLALEKTHALCRWNGYDFNDYQVYGLRMNPSSPRYLPSKEVYSKLYREIALAHSRAFCFVFSSTCSTPSLPSHC